MSDTLSTPTDPDSDVVAYCAGCNQRFPSGTATCPQCGSEIARIPSTIFADTQMVPTDYLGGDGTGDNGTDLEPENGPVIPSRAEVKSLVDTELGAYRLERLLGSGGMGQVYLARHTRLDRPCAIKILSPKTVAQDIDYVRRFQYEGRAAAGLIHPNIVTVHDINEHDGLHYMEMEFVAGRSLQTLLEIEGPLPPIRATVLAVQIAQGLAVAHREGIIHRDLKADNVLLTYRGLPKIADFGLAKRVLDNDGVPSERIVGTPHYMAPELFRGEPASASSDVYALGIVYYQMLTGELPFGGAQLNEIRHRIQSDPIPPVRDLDPNITLEMAEAVAKLMDKSPANRPVDAVEAVHLLQAVLGEVQDLESLLQDAFDGDPYVSFDHNGPRYRVTLNFPDGRHQCVFVEPSDQTTSERLLMVYSRCCPAQPNYFEQALRLNSEIPHGGLAIRDIDGESYFVMIDTAPRSTTTPETLKRSVREVGTRADFVEHLLTGEDIN